MAEMHACALATAWRELSQQTAQTRNRVSIVDRPFKEIGTCWGPIVTVKRKRDFLTQSGLSEVDRDFLEMRGTL